MQKEIDRLINSYRNNALSREEAGMLAGWLEESDEHRAQFRECLAGREQPASAKAEREWARFAARNKILFAVPEGVNTRRRLFRRYVAAAAVLAAGICAVWFWQGVPAVPDAGNGTEIGAAQPLEYRTARGEKLDIVLPDGSKVCMNSEATLTVDLKFGKATREIEFDGEAFFTIAPDKSCPFIIHSANNNYTVLGTSFNLQSYAREKFAVVTLHTGCLQAQVKKDVIILDPNEELQIDATANTITKRAVRIDDSIGWIEGRLGASAERRGQQTFALLSGADQHPRRDRQPAIYGHGGSGNAAGGPSDDLRNLPCKALHHQYRRGIFPFEGEAKIENEFFNYLNIK